MFESALHEFEINELALPWYKEHYFVKKPNSFIAYGVSRPRGIWPYVSLRFRGPFQTRYMHSFENPCRSSHKTSLIVRSTQCIYTFRVIARLELPMRGVKSRQRMDGF